MSTVATNYNTSSLRSMLKEYYIDSGRVRTIEYMKDKTFGMIDRKGKGEFEYSTGGKYAVIPIDYGEQSSNSKTFSVAQARAKKSASAGKFGAWQIKMDKEAVIGRVDLETYHATKDQKGSFLKPLLKNTTKSISSLAIDRKAGKIGFEEPARFVTPS